MEEPDLFLSGVSGVTGEPLVRAGDLPPLRVLHQENRENKGLINWLARRLASLASPHWGLPLEVNPLNPAQAGWAVVFHEAEAEPVRRALAPLIEHREHSLGSGRLRILDYRSGEEWRSWLARHGTEPGSVLPDRVPYYVLLAGSPALIPFDFQSMLAVEYAVGRLSFDQPEDYGRYAESVSAYETAATVPNSRQAVIFGTCHPGDRATEILADHLTAPLADGFVERWGFAGRKLLGSAATRANLGDVFSPPPGELPPALLFTATHGMGFPAGHAAQQAAQGALLCQDWTGRGTIGSSQYFAAADLPDDARLHGLISFHFACYGAGTPDRDAFLHVPGAPPPVIAAEPFVARLPQRLLSHPRGGALAVIGHVDRAWGYSVVGSDRQSHRLPFENTLGALLQGWPVGHAVRDFRQRFAALSASLSERLERQGFGAEVPEQELRRLWTERNDARNYAVLGDPAARLRIDALPEKNAVRMHK